MDNMEAALDGSAETRQICFAKLMDTWSRYRRTWLWLTDRVRFAFTDNRLSAELSRITVLNSSAKIPQLAVRR
ncbi:hypothetical protein T12_3110 [Trichinella patagoniensis]|uniref:Uncharacterized protein n=1 Tax=Trichinella patagoniensis TaxID=990121 RepID=A0A0V0Z4S4_9BILA|nr:hypothetical protein T12_3110 [Trichinella patagoniensis]